MFGKYCIYSALALVAVCFSEEHHEQWRSFKENFDKVYTPEEHQERFLIFAENLNKIKEHNKLYDEGKVTYKMGVTQFADLSKEEFMDYLTLRGKKPVNSIKNTYVAPFGEVLPDSVDYRKQGAVNPIKAQLHCGSCYAFSTTGSLEVNNFLKTGVKLSLSEQDIVDCSGAYGNMGCDGGHMDKSFDYIIDNGIAENKDYPYAGVAGSCNTTVAKSNIKVTGYTAIKTGDESDLKSAVANIGAVSVGIDCRDFQFYHSGILTHGVCCNNTDCLNHGVTLIGYGSENGKDYWIVRNSWGQVWGEEGYIRLGRGFDNLCGIATDATYPIIA